MGSAKRNRQKANRAAAREAAAPRPPELSEADLLGLLTEVTVRADCEHASTRGTIDALVLVSCAVEAGVAGGCPIDCRAFEARRAGGLGYGIGAG